MSTLTNSTTDLSAFHSFSVSLLEKDEYEGRITEPSQERKRERGRRSVPTHREVVVQRVRDKRKKESKKKKRKGKQNELRDKEVMR